MIYLLSKKPRYYFDHEAIKEEAVKKGTPAHLAGGSGERAGTRGGLRKIKVPGGWAQNEGSHGTTHKEGRTRAKYKTLDISESLNSSTSRKTEGFNDRWDNGGEERTDGKRSKRSVWTVPPRPFAEAHFATFPPDLIRPCILAGCPEGGTVLDPFFGAGTTGLVAQQHGRNCIGIELNADYINIAKRRLGLVEREGVFA
jgi:site-specific DNA-methyltransferase (adenine-specific)